MGTLVLISFPSNYSPQKLEIYNASGPFHTVKCGQIQKWSETMHGLVIVVWWYNLLIYLIYDSKVCSDTFKPPHMPMVQYHFVFSFKKNVWRNELFHNFQVNKILLLLHDKCRSSDVQYSQNRGEIDDQNQNITCYVIRNKRFNTTIIELH